MSGEARPSGIPVRVNGEEHLVHTEQDTALLYALRSHLGLLGSRFGCGLGLCGACFVLVDGVPTYSCDTPMWAVVGKEVVTVEGLGSEGAPHPVAQAIIDGQAAQCGYCMSGIAIAAVAFLTRNPDPTEGDIRVALDRNLCRCGAHNRVVDAVLAAGAAMRAASSARDPVGERESS